MERKVLLAVIAILILLLTAYITYRVTVENISIEVSGDTAYLTVFGMTDEYKFEG